VSVVASKNPPAVPKLANASVEPFGFRIEILVLQQVGPTSMLTRCPEVPVKVRPAFWPGVVVVTVTGGPPATIPPVRSAGTS
jgi:hypothetical protein